MCYIGIAKSLARPRVRVGEYAHGGVGRGRPAPEPFPAVHLEEAVVGDIVVGLRRTPASAEPNAEIPQMMGGNPFKRRPASTTN